MIRRAKPKDQTAIISLARQFHEATRTPISFSQAMAEALFRACLTNDDLLCLVLVKDQIVVGFLAAHCSALHFSNERIAQEIAWFIDPKSRGLESLKMLELYETWAVERGCKYASMVGLGYDPITQKLYQRRGYTAQERHFLKPL